MLDTDDLVHDDLQQVCRYHGGFLPEPKDVSENRFLDNLGTETFALGMTDVEVEGEWVWDSEGSPVTWVRWSEYNSEPSGGTNNNCALMLRYMFFFEEGYSSDGWRAYRCPSHSFFRNKPRSLICQRNSGKYIIDCIIAYIARENSL